MHENDGEPRALFLFPDSTPERDDRICSGQRPLLLEGNPCPFSQNGRIPHPLKVKEMYEDETRFPGLPDDLAPPCAINQLGMLAAWEEKLEGANDPSLRSLRLLKCRQMFLFVIPGLRDASPDRLNAFDDA